MKIKLMNYVPKNVATQANSAAQPKIFEAFSYKENIFLKLAAQLCRWASRFSRAYGPNFQFVAYEVGYSGRYTEILTVYDENVDGEDGNRLFLKDAAGWVEFRKDGFKHTLKFTEKALIEQISSTYISEAYVVQRRFPFKPKIKAIDRQLFKMEFETKKAKEALEQAKLLAFDARFAHLDDKELLELIYKGQTPKLDVAEGRLMNVARQGF